MSDFIVFGIRRGGNHAIAQWLIPQIVGGVKYGHAFTLRGTRDNEFIAYGEGENTYIGFEDIRFSEFSENKENWLNGIELNDLKTIMVLRNPWNLIASHVQWKIKRPLYTRKNKVISLWFDYYNEYEAADKDINFIIYDKWFKDINYRKQISEKLGLEFSDEGLQTVVNIGRGSSFDGIEYDGNAQDMDVLSRYKQVDNYSMNTFKESEIGQDLKNKWNHLCDLEEIKELKII